MRVRADEVSLALVRRPNGRSEWIFTERAADAPPLAEMAKTMRSLLSVSERSGVDPETFWWWITDPAIESMAAQLCTHHYCVIDGMLDPVACDSLRAEVLAVRNGGHLSSSRLAGGRDGNKLTYTHTAVRGDLVGWCVQPMRSLQMHDDLIA